MAKSVTKHSEHPPSQTSVRFSKTRRAHQSEQAEDYVEAILELIEDDGDAKLTELAVHMGVAHPTVSKTLKRLHREGLVVLTPYAAIQLTSTGLKLARACRKRHTIVTSFLRVLGIDQKTAENDAEGIEHHVSPKTLKAMERFLDPKKTARP